MACHMALSPRNVIFVNISLRDIGIKVWISRYPAISVSFRTVHSAGFFGLDCFALFCFVLLCCVISCFGGIKPPWGGFITPKGVVLSTGGRFIPHKGWFYPPKGVVLSPKRGGFSPHKTGHKNTRGGFKGGFIPHLGVVLCPGLQVQLGQDPKKGYAFHPTLLNSRKGIPYHRHPHKMPRHPNFSCPENTPTTQAFGEQQAASRRACALRTTSHL